MLQHKFKRLTAKQQALSGLPPPTIPNHAKAGLAVANADKPLNDVDPQFVVREYLGGKSIIAIAKSLGVSHIALYDFLWKRIPEDWPSIRAARAEGQYDTAMESLCDLETPLDGLTIARMREAARFRFGELGVLRRQFAQKQEITTNVQPVLNIQIVASAPQQTAISGQPALLDNK